MESPLTAINSAVAAVQKIPESQSALQSGFEKTKNVVTGNGLPLVSTKKRNVGSNNTIITIHGRGVDKALVAEQKPLESQNATDTLLVSMRTRYKSK